VKISTFFYKGTKKNLTQDLIKKVQEIKSYFESERTKKPYSILNLDQEKLTNRINDLYDSFCVKKIPRVEFSKENPWLHSWLADNIYGENFDKFLQRYKKI